jgi:CHASE2 domain-containing sensor protein
MKDDPGAILMPGSEIQANLLDTLLNDDPIVRLPTGVYVVLILALGIAGAVIAGRLRPMRAIAGSLGLAVAYLAVSQLGFSWWNVWIEVVPVILPLIVGAGTIISVSYMRSGGPAVASRLKPSGRSS